jgi:hypothetical protein
MGHLFANNGPSRDNPPLDVLPRLSHPVSAPPTLAAHPARGNHFRAMEDGLEFQRGGSSLLDNGREPNLAASASSMRDPGAVSTNAGRSAEKIACRTFQP